MSGEKSLTSVDLDHGAIEVRRGSVRMSNTSNEEYELLVGGE